jgi:hypothetical protein
MSVHLDSENSVVGDGRELDGRVVNLMNARRIALKYAKT